MTTLDGRQLNAMMVNNQVVPDEGTKAVAFILDFTADDVFELDLAQFMNQARISQVQTVFVDLKDSNVPLKITVNATGQELLAKPFTQGYYNILASNPLKLTFTCPGGPLMKMFLLNVPIPGAVWPTQ